MQEGGAATQSEPDPAPAEEASVECRHVPGRRGRAQACWGGPAAGPGESRPEPRATAKGRWPPTAEARIRASLAESKAAAASGMQAELQQSVARLQSRGPKAAGRPRAGEARAAVGDTHGGWQDEAAQHLALTDGEDGEAMEPLQKDVALLGSLRARFEQLEHPRASRLRSKPRAKAPPATADISTPRRGSIAEAPPDSPAKGSSPAVLRDAERLLTMSRFVRDCQRTSVATEWGRHERARLAEAAQRGIEEAMAPHRCAGLLVTPGKLQ